MFKRDSVTNVHKVLGYRIHYRGVCGGTPSIRCRSIKQASEVACYVASQGFDSEQVWGQILTPHACECFSDHLLCTTFL